MSPAFRARSLWLSGIALLALSGAVVAQKAPESLLPPGFDNPPPAPKPAPTKAAPAPSSPQAPGPATTSVPVVQALPGGTSAPAAAPVDPAKAIADSIDPELLEELIEKARPKYDIPPGSQRSLLQVGALAEQDGGLPMFSTVRLNGAFIGPIIENTRGQFVSRWGQILMRRALASRLSTPVGMNGADWAAIRAAALLRMGEAEAARAVVQSVDSGAFTPKLEDAALNAFVATADPVGMCPIVGLTAAKRQGRDWDLVRAICSAFTGNGPPAMSQFDRLLGAAKDDKIDVLLAQKYAGTSAASRRAVTVEWKDVTTMTPWRYGMALAVGIEPPAEAMKDAGPGYALLAARAPMLSLNARATAADVAGARGVLSSAAMVDLYSQIYALEQEGDERSTIADNLRSAYVAQAESDRIAAIRSVWGSSSDSATAYSRRVLTAYAAARIMPAEGLSSDAADLIGSMLAAGLDRNALLWAPAVKIGSHAWGMLSLAAPNPPGPVAGDALGAFYDDDGSDDYRRSQFLLAGLMGLKRVTPSDAAAFAGKLEIDMNRSTAWTKAIDAAADSNNPALVAFLAGYGMQGDNWTDMTPVHLYHIVGALRRVGLEAEARMIAAEAVSRV